ncbi:hypothetical protein EFP84_13715 [Leptospira kmetyi]|uniref:Uncharacterized protein n=1 Tax=Leptospira kmetyi TaxID=408139 RepID=A0AAD0UUI8_9LEPT|nr:hypothetical protein EFP84_13715 [Leptospira kmetyi]
MDGMIYRVEALLKLRQEFRFRFRTKDSGIWKKRRSLRRQRRSQIRDLNRLLLNVRVAGRARRFGPHLKLLMNNATGPLPKYFVLDVRSAEMK